MTDDVPRVERPELLKAYNEGWELVNLRAAVSAYLEADEVYHNRDSRDTGVAYSAVVKARAELRQVLATSDTSDDPPTGETTAADEGGWADAPDPAVKREPVEDMKRFSFRSVYFYDQTHSYLKTLRDWSDQGFEIKGVVPDAGERGYTILLQREFEDESESVEDRKGEP